MPIYAYRCESCGHAKDVLQKMSDPLLTVCPACGEPAFKKQVTAAGFQLKGSGWYVTDFRGDKKAAEAQAGDAKAGDAKTGEGSGGAPADGSKAGETVKPGAAAGAKASASGEGGATASPAPTPAPAPAPAPAASPSSGSRSGSGGGTSSP